MNLDSRKQLILSAVVRDYIATVKPVGSEDLASRHAWGVKSATIRNELAELSDLGFLRQPHTSSGRIPSDQGYRFYVDHLMIVSERHKFEIDRTFENAIELEWLLRQTCALLSRATSYTSVATFPTQSDVQVSHLFLAQAGEQILVTVVLNTGQVVNRLVPGLANMSAEMLATAANVLSAKYRGNQLGKLDLSECSFASRPDSEYSPQMSRTLELTDSAIRQMLSEVFIDDNVVIEGASEMMRQPEFRDVAKFESLYDALEHSNITIRTLRQSELQDSVSVVIGSENTLPEMQECTLVSGTYRVGTSESGMIGILAPTRMDYDMAVPLVRQFAISLTSLLARIGES